MGKPCAYCGKPTHKDKGDKPVFCNNSCSGLYWGPKTGRLGGRPLPPPPTGDNCRFCGLVTENGDAVCDMCRGEMIRWGWTEAQMDAATGGKEGIGGRPRKDSVGGVR